MKFIKIIGLLCLICITFFYTDRVITVTMEQDEIMIKIKELAKNTDYPPTNAIIKDDTIIPGSIGKYIDTVASYKEMKKIGYFEPNIAIYKNIYPEVSIYNNYSKYIIKGNSNNKAVSLIYIINNTNTIDSILNITKLHNTPINFFIDSNFLNNNINIIDKLKGHEVYNYGANGKYTKDNLIYANNIINNKSSNRSIFCLFTKKDEISLNSCSNNRMLSIYPTTGTNFYNIKTNLTSGSIFIFDNTKELNTIIEYINTKGYRIVPLSDLITE